jgi:ectoine hydroxylase-related dioxygenase (phytanoyl-CoA dioxygenase family)
MQAYFRDGAARARTLGNRGPVRYTSDGALHPDILEAYDRVGFYVFEGMIGREELSELEAAFNDIMDRTPTERGSPVDAHGRPAIGTDHDAPSLVWTKPLADPLGGTDASEGRHQIKMFEPEAPAEAPAQIVASIVGSLQYADALLRLYGHPDLLRIAEAVLGPDFVPFTDAIVIKKAREGGIIAWHQDGMTHWDSPSWHSNSHGYNAMGQLYGSTPATGVWYVPGSHKLGRVDLRKLAAEAGSEQFANAVPLIAAPGDIAISNRQAVHGSFANTSPDTRITFNMGFLPRSSVVDASGYNYKTEQRGRLDEARIRERCKVIGYAIDARRQRFPDEGSFVYQPHAAAGEEIRWDAVARAAMRGYNARDLIV